MMSAGKIENKILFTPVTTILLGNAQAVDPKIGLPVSRQPSIGTPSLSRPVQERRDFHSRLQSFEDVIAAKTLCEALGLAGPGKVNAGGFEINSRPGNRDGSEYVDPATIGRHGRVIN